MVLITFILRVRDAPRIAPATQLASLGGYAAPFGGGHCDDSAVGVVGDGRLAGAVDGVAGGATEGVVETGQLEIVLPLVGAMSVEIVGVEIRDNASGSCVNEVSNAVVRHADGRGDTVVVIFGAREITGVIVGVVGCNAARPNAARQFAVWGVRVRRAFPVGVYLVRHAARRFVVEPAGRVAVSERLVAVGGH